MALKTVKHCLSGETHIAIFINGGGQGLHLHLCARWGGHPGTQLLCAYTMPMPDLSALLLQFHKNHQACDLEFHHPSLQSKKYHRMPRKQYLWESKDATNCNNLQVCGDSLVPLAFSPLPGPWGHKDPGLSGHMLSAPPWGLTTEAGWLQREEPSAAVTQQRMKVLCFCSSAIHVAVLYPS